MFKYIFKNWKIIIHLLFKTKRFGVNNLWRSDFDSMFGCSLKERIWMIILIKPFIDNYKMIKFRAIACHFISDEVKVLFGWNKKQNKKLTKEEIEYHCKRFNEKYPTARQRVW